MCEPKITFMQESELVTNRQVLDFFTVANDFCIFIEEAGKARKPAIFAYLNKVLPLLYLKGALLPDVETEYPEALERFVTEEQWQDNFNALRNMFGEDDLFIYCDPDTRNTEHIKASLAEHLADIYQDMKDFVLLYSKNMQAARENAIIEISGLFRSHWGHRVLFAMTRIHFLLHNDSIESDDLEIF